MTTQRALRRVLTVLLALGPLLLVNPAGAADRQAPRDEVFRALGIDKVSADYVIAVDTSGSMQGGGLYSQVIVALRPLLRALVPGDHLSLLTFDTVPALRYSGSVGTPGDRALSQLPRYATGAKTDLGSAISTSLGELQRPEASRIQTLILITDGKHDPPRGSAYPTTTGPGWSRLAARARALTGMHPVASYALAVRPETDAALLAQVMPETQVLNLPRYQLAGFFDRVKADIRTSKARALLAPDLDGPVQVSWRQSDLTNLNFNRGHQATVVTVESTTLHLPLTLTSLTLRSSGIGVQASGLPDTVTLAPGESRSFPAKLVFDKRGGFGFGQRTETESGKLQLISGFDSPWHDVVSQYLKLQFSPKLTGATVVIKATGTTGWTWTRLGMLLAVALAVLAAVITVLRVRQPRLRGTLAAAVPGQPAKQINLGGRSIRIGATRGSRLAISGKGRVRARKRPRPGRRGHDVELIIKYAAGTGRPKRGNCRAGASTTIDGVTFSYQNQN